MRLHYEIIKEGDSMIGQVLEFPSIIVFAPNKKILEQQIITATKGYFIAFPDEMESRRRSIRGFQTWITSKEESS